MTTAVDRATSLIRTELSISTNPCVTCSFQDGCLVLVHLIRRVAPDVPVLFLDTLHHFPETVAFAGSIAKAWSLNLITLRASRPSIGLWQTSVDACCGTHKVAPLFDALNGFDCWLAGLRREQSRSRASLEETGPFTLPSGHRLRKVSPLASWTGTMVTEYLGEHGIPRLPLYAQGYASIGCAPCTTPPTDPRDVRSGRWQGRKLECGIHVSAGATRRDG